MPFVQAKCPECGGMLAVDGDKKAAVCQFCGEAFIVKEAINNYNTYNETINNYNTTHNYGDGTTVNVYEDKSRDFVVEAGVLKEYHGESVYVYLPENIKSIELNCFAGQPIEMINLGTNNIDIDNVFYSLDKCLKLRSVEACPDNSRYTSEDGILYNKDKTYIIFIPKAYPRDNFTVKLSISEISNNIHNTLISFSHLNYGDVDFMNLHCQDFKSIELAKRINLPYKITKHNFVDNICTSCDAFNVLEEIHNGDFKIGIMENDSLYLCSVFGQSDLLSDKISYREVDVLRCKTLYIGEFENLSLEKVNQFISRFKNVKKIVWTKDTYTWNMHILTNNNYTKEVLNQYFKIELKKLREIVFLEGVTQLPVFENCTELEEVQLPNTIESITARAFAECTSLRHINLPNSLKHIFGGAFFNCYFLENVRLPSNLKDVGGSAFVGCNKLKNMTIPNSLLNKIQNDAYRVRNIMKASAAPFHGENAFSEVWKYNNKCSHCGGAFSIFNKCKICNSKKDY